MEHYAEQKRSILSEVDKEMPRHLDFTNQFFKELKSFIVEDQVEILNYLYRRLEDVYQSEIDVNLKTAEDYKQRLSVLKKVEPKN